jgi:hypothetical protein
MIVIVSKQTRFFWEVGRDDKACKLLEEAFGLSMDRDEEERCLGRSKWDRPSFSGIVFGGLIRNSQVRGSVACTTRRGGGLDDAADVKKLVGMGRRAKA